MRDTDPIMTMGVVFNATATKLTSMPATPAATQQGRPSEPLNLSGNQRLSHGRTAADIRHLGAQAILFE
jgi:hypothetical protein